MKKLLLSMALISAVSAGAQVMQNENFNSLTLGEIGTDITGTTPGQDNWLTFSSNGAAPTTSTNAANDNFLVVEEGNDGYGVKFIGPDGNKGSRFMWKDGFPDLWAARDVGNDVLNVEYDLYTGPDNGSTGQVGVRVYGNNGTADVVLNGFVFNVGTKILQGVAYLNNAGTFNTYLITLQTGGLVLDPDTWYRIGFSYNTTTGETVWKASTVYTGLPAANWAGPYDPLELDMVWGTPNTNAESTEVVFDNLLAYAAAEENLLGVQQPVAQTAFTVSPNPSSSVVNIVNASPVSHVTITDLNGRVVKQQDVAEQNNVQVNIDALAAGVYVMKVKSAGCSAVKKIVKQ